MTKSILIVDDSKLARMVIRKTLRDLDAAFDLTEASAPGEAYQLVVARPYDIVLLDYNMPEENGLQLAERIRALRPDAAIVLVTANVQDAIVQKARGMGLQFVGKPVTADALRTAFRQLQGAQ